jgi:hypothetical protein
MSDILLIGIIVQLVLINIQIANLSKELQK